MLGGCGPADRISFSQEDEKQKPDFGGEQTTHGIIRTGGRDLAYEGTYSRNQLSDQPQKSANLGAGERNRTLICVVFLLIT